MFVCFSAPLKALRFSDVSVRGNCSLSVLVISSMQLLSLLNDRVNPDTLSELRLRSPFCALCSFSVLPHRGTAVRCHAVYAIHCEQAAISLSSFFTFM